MHLFISNDDMFIIIVRVRKPKIESREFYCSMLVGFGHDLVMLDNTVKPPLSGQSGTHGRVSVEQKYP